MAGENIARMRVRHGIQIMPAAMPQFDGNSFIPLTKTTSTYIIYFAKQWTWTTWLTVSSLTQRPPTHDTHIHIIKRRLFEKDKTQAPCLPGCIFAADEGVLNQHTQGTNPLWGSFPIDIFPKVFLLLIRRSVDNFPLLECWHTFSIPILHDARQSTLRSVVPCNSRI